MAKAKDVLGWLRELFRIEVPRAVARSESIVERLEGLIPPVDLIERSYKVDRRIAAAGHKVMLATEELIKASLKKQQQAIEVSELLLDQQEATSDIIDTQVNKQLNAETIIQNFRIFLTEDELTIQWILEHIFKPALFAAAFGNLDESRQRELFNALSRTVNSLQRKDGMLAEPEQPRPMNLSNASPES